MNKKYEMNANLSDNMSQEKEWAMKKKERKKRQMMQY